MLAGVIYGHAFYDNLAGARLLLKKAVERLLRNATENPPPEILWSMYFDQLYTPPSTLDDKHSAVAVGLSLDDHVIQLPDLGSGLALEDDVLKQVKAAYEKIMGEGKGFMIFEDREGTGDDGEGGGEGDI